MSHESNSVLAWIGQGLILLARHFDRFNQRQEQIQMDTKKILEAVEREKTERASLLALAKGQNQALVDAGTKMSGMSDQIAQLKAKIDEMGAGQSGGGQSGDQQKDEQIKALQDQVSQLQASAVEAQSQIDKAAEELDADNADVQEVLSANVPQSGAPGGQSGAGSAGSNSSSSSSAASDGGGGQKPSPLPGTGAPQTGQSDSQNAQSSGSDQSSGQASSGGGTIAPTDTPALSGGIADPSVPGSMPQPEDADAAGQTGRALGSDPTASQQPKSGA